MPDPIIAAEGLGIRFPRAPGPALEDVSFQVRPGARLLVAGPSGSGKSTLALTLNGLIPQSIRAEQQGVMLVAGLDTVDTPVGDLVRQVGMVFQDPDSQFCLERVEDEVAFVLENQGAEPSRIGPAVAAALDQAGLGGQGGRLLEQLSGGQKQRVALAAALVQQPDVLVLDEPTSNLDPAGAAEAFAALGTIPPATTVVVIEHRLEEALALCDEVLILGTGGHLLARGPARETIARQAGTLAQLGAWLPEKMEACLATGLPPDTPDDVLLHELEDRCAPGSPPGGSGPVLRAARDLSLGYAGEAVVHGVGLDLRAGEVLALIGSNGSGKTTLLQGLAGLVDPLAGVVSGERAVLVFQNPEHQFVAGSVREEVAWGLRVAGVDPAGIQARTDEALARFGLEALAEQHPFRLSQGQKRRLSVAALAVLEPPVLLADEPTFGLDRAAAVAVMRWFRDLAAQGSAVAIASHDLRLVAAFADRIAVVQNGRVVMVGPAADVLAWEGLGRAAGARVSGLTRWWLARGHRDGLGPFLRSCILGAA